MGFLFVIFVNEILFVGESQCFLSVEIFSAHFILFVKFQDFANAELAQVSLIYKVQIKQKVYKYNARLRVDWAVLET